MSLLDSLPPAQLEAVSRISGQLHLWSWANAVSYGGVNAGEKALIMSRLLKSLAISSYTIRHGFDLGYVVLEVMERLMQSSTWIQVTGEIHSHETIILTHYISKKRKSLTLDQFIQGMKDTSVPVVERLREYLGLHAESITSDLKANKQASTLIEEQLSKIIIHLQELEEALGDSDTKAQSFEDNQFIQFQAPKGIWKYPETKIQSFELKRLPLVGAIKQEPIVGILPRLYDRFWPVSKIILAAALLAFFALDAYIVYGQTDWAANFFAIPLLIMIPVIPVLCVVWSAWRASPERISVCSESITSFKNGVKKESVPVKGALVEVDGDRILWVRRPDKGGVRLGVPVNYHSLDIEILKRSVELMQYQKVDNNTP